MNLTLSDQDKSRSPTNRYGNDFLRDTTIMTQKRRNQNKLVNSSFNKIFTKDWKIDTATTIFRRPKAVKNGGKS